MENKIPSSWNEMISEQEASGKSAASWCKEDGIPTSTFYYRRKKVKAAGEGAIESPSTKNEVVKIDFKREETQMNLPTVHHKCNRSCEFKLLGRI